jgi:Holliday junction resolvase RusA-like endonuclease
MSRKQFIYYGELPALRQHIIAERYRGTSKRGNPVYTGNSLKQKYTRLVAEQALTCKFKITKPVVICFDWYVKNFRNDPDNIAFGKKYILDGLVKAGVLSDDRHEQIKGFIDKFYVDKKEPKVIINFVEL